MMEQSNDEFRDIIKIIIVGDAGTGKTNIVYSFTREKVPHNIMPTIAVEFASKLVTLDNGELAKVQIWDTAGQQTYRSLTMRQLYYRKMSGAIVVYDVTKRTSFDHVRYWLQNVREKGDPNVQILLLGHKNDVTRREVRYEEGQELALQEHIFYGESSVKDPFTVMNAFKKLIAQINIVSRDTEHSPNDYKMNRGERTRSGCAC